MGGYGGRALKINAYNLYNTASDLTMNQRRANKVRFREPTSSTSSEWKVLNSTVIIWLIEVPCKRKLPSSM